MIPQDRFDKTKQHSAVTVWKLGPLWWLSCYKLFSLSPTHSRPSGGVAAHRVTTSEKQTLYNRSTLSSLLTRSVTRTLNHKNLRMKSKNFTLTNPGDAGITIRMIQAGGPRFEEFLHEVFGTLWQNEMQPKPQKNTCQNIWHLILNLIFCLFQN